VSTVTTPISQFRAGDVVEVRPAAEILATLDENGELDSVPFMPEMLQFVGRRFTVSKRALKICSPVGNAHMTGTVFLEQLRCDGSAHDGCQAACRIFWREQWLRPVSSSSGEIDATAEAERRLDALTRANVRWTRTIDQQPEEVFHCQATETTRAAVAVSWREPTQYVREVSSGNVGLWHFTRVMSRAVLRAVAVKLRIVDELPVKTAGAGRVDGEQLDLQPGEWVEVRSLEEIGRTLDANGKHRGLTFTYEMAQHCGKRFRVRRKVNRLIDEPTGRMVEIKRDCVELDGLYCTGDRALFLWFCRRDHFPYWREAWLRRVDPPPVQVADQDIGETRVDAASTSGVP
jgi:hypothetical protein